MKIAIAGTGYVGLVAGACWASRGHNVTCVDVDAQKIAMLREGRSPIHEPGLDDLIKGAIEEGTICFSTELADAAREALVTVIAVGTPSDEDGSFNGRYLLAAAGEIGSALRGTDEPKYVVVRSTVDTDLFRDAKLRVIEASGGHGHIDVISNPEFLAQGRAVQDFLKPDRIIIGTESSAAETVMQDLYADFVKEGGSIHFMRPESAIMVKLGANNHLYNRIVLNEELARICDATGADYAEVRAAIGLDRRIGPQFLYAGPGAGGSCFGKDNRGLAALARRHGISLDLLPHIDAANDLHKRYLVEGVMEPFYAKHGGLQGKTIGVWGLAFKANTDDVRDSASIPIINQLLSRGAIVRVHDPVAMQRARGEFGDRVTYHDSKYDVASSAQGLLLLTEWPTYRNPDFGELRQRLTIPVIFDGRAMLKVHQVLEHGIAYYGMGRGIQHC